MGNSSRRATDAATLTGIRPGRRITVRPQSGASVRRSGRRLTCECAHSLARAILPSATRALWPQPLARRWRSEYPHIFDSDDLRLALAQPRNHFAEWFVAIHLFHRDGAYSLLEKYLYGNHPANRPSFASSFPNSNVLYSPTSTNLCVFTSGLARVRSRPAAVLVRRGQSPR